MPGIEHFLIASAPTIAARESARNASDRAFTSLTASGAGTRSAGQRGEESGASRGGGRGGRGGEGGGEEEEGVIGRV